MGGRKCSTGIYYDATLLCSSRKMEEKKEKVQMATEMKDVSPEQVNAMKHGNASCLICLNPFLNNDLLRQLTPCLHLYHKKCIDTYLLGTKSDDFCFTNCCPHCRTEVVATKTNADNTTSKNNNDTMDDVDDVNDDRTNTRNMKLLSSVLEMSDESDEGNDSDRDSRSSISLAWSTMEEESMTMHRSQRTPPLSPSSGSDSDAYVDIDSIASPKSITKKTREEGVEEMDSLRMVSSPSHSPERSRRRSSGTAMPETGIPYISFFNVGTDIMNRNE